MTRSIGQMFPTWISLVLQILTVTAQQESISKPPTDTTGLVQNTAIFTCQVEYGNYETLTWKFKDTLIYQFLDGKPDYPEGKDKYEVTKSGKKYTLEISNLAYSDAGEYTCLVTMVNARAALIVLGKPSITIDPPNPVEGDTVLFGCEACFGGSNKDTSSAQYPELKMVFGNASFEGEAQTNHRQEYSCLNMVLNRTVDAGENGQQISCEIRTPRPKKSSNFTILNVLYPVRNASYLPLGAKFEFGTNLSCKADGNPQPTFVWENLKKPGMLFRRKWLNITENMEGQNVWKCTGQNSIGNVTYTDTIEVTFEAQPISLDHSTSGSTNKDIIIVVIVIVMIIVFGIALYLWWKRKKENNRQPLEEMQRLQEGQKSADCMAIIHNLQTKEDLDRAVPHIEDMLEKEMLEPTILLEMVKKANALIESEQYMPIIQRMAEIYQRIEPEDGPLHCLHQQIVSKKSQEVLFKNQKKMCSLIRVLIRTDHAEQRSKLLRDLIKHSEYYSMSTSALTWTEDLMSTLKLLLEEGADPTWKPEDAEHHTIEPVFTAQYAIFDLTSRLLLEGECASQIPYIWPMFLNPVTQDAKYHRGTPLHALATGFDWKLLNKFREQHGGLPNDFFKQYKDIMKIVIDHDQNFREMKDFRWRTPLHLFMEKIELHEGDLQEFEEIVLLLKSRNYMNIVDENGYNVMHFLADAYPVFYKETSEKGQERFLDFFETHKDHLKEDVIDTNGNTALHILVKKYKDTEQFEKLFLRLVKVLTTKSDIRTQDSEGRTAVHILAKNCSKHILKQNIFTELDQIQYIIDCKDHEWHTVLHILAKRVFDEPDFGKDLISMFTLFATKQNVNAPDKKSLTPYSWILKGKFSKKNSDTADIFSKIEKILLEKKADAESAQKGFPFIEKYQESEEPRVKSQRKEEPEKEVAEEKLRRLEDYIAIPKRHDFIRGYLKDLRHYMLIDDELMERLALICHDNKDYFERQNLNTEDEKIEGLIVEMWNVEDNKKYFNILEVLSEENEDLVNLLTGGKWTRQDHQ